MPHFTFSSTRPDEVLYGKSIPCMWMGELNVSVLDKTSKDVLDRLKWDFGTEHVDQILAEAPKVTDATIGDYLTKTKWKPCDTMSYATEITKSQADIDTFFATYFTATPPTIRVHLTQIGSGGSFHSFGRHYLSRQGPAISVRPDCKKERPLHVIVHETIHLAIDAAVEAVTDESKFYPVKEAIVDQVMSSKPGQQLVGPSEPRPKFLPVLPADWQKLPCFKVPLS
jgi:hypothetical protein